MLRISLAPFSVLLATSLLAGLTSAAEARRTVIDGNQYGTTYEVSTDLEDGDGTTLPFAVNYGSGPQTDLIANFGPCCLGTVNEPPYVQVGLTFASSPSDFLFATLLQEQFVDAGVRTSNNLQASTPLVPVGTASNFNFGMTTFITGGPPQVPGPGTGNLGFYSPFFGAANMSFTDLSASGVAGDFGLQLICNGICTSIGFNLGGLSFSSLLFDPNAPPPQLVSYNVGSGTSTFNFVFRNSSGVPEPGTWLSMLLGFGIVGAFLRRQRASNPAQTV